jgi:hypothetical protein
VPDDLFTIRNQARPTPTGLFQGSETSMGRIVRLIVVISLVAGLCAACLGTPGDTSKISLVSSTTVNGWRYDYYRNPAYPCSISGDQTFVVGTKVGSSPTAPAPLFVWMHGGGIGWFDAGGTPQPDTQQMTEQSAATLQAGLTNAGLLTSIRNDPAGFRVLAVSYCTRDLYSGDAEADPHNPNLNADGSVKATNGLLATKAAVTFAQTAYPTSKYFLAGGSAGSAGAYEVAWAEQVSNDPPAGVVGDASVLNAEQGEAAYAQGVCRNPAFSPDGAASVQQRFAREIGNIANEPDKLVSRGLLTVPLLHIWNHGDTNTCGAVPMQCPLRNGSVVTMGATDCNHEPLAAAITAKGPDSRSKNLPVCVDNDTTANCSLHVVTTHAGLTNTDPAGPANYLAAVVAWVNARLADA